MPKSPESGHDRTKGSNRGRVKKEVLDALVEGYITINLDASNAKNPDNSLRKKIIENYDKRNSAPETPPEENS